MLPPPTTTTRRPCNFTNMGKRLMIFVLPLPFHAVGHGTERDIALDSSDEGAGQQRGQCLVGMAAEKLAQIFVSFALRVETFEQSFDCVGHSVRCAAVANGARDGSKLADTTANAEGI